LGGLDERTSKADVEEFLSKVIFINSTNHSSITFFIGVNDMDGWMDGWDECDNRLVH
jgi:hypothetical protein